MSSKIDNERQKLIQDKCQIILGNLLREEDNKYCVDCDAKGPRWASWNLGIFLCIRCAGIHRNLGVHISKVKSVNLDTWTPEQVACLQQMGNSQARAVYEANLPESFRRPQTDSSLEAFIRAKYEHKKYIAKEWVPPPTPKPAFDIEEEKRKEKEKKKKTKAASALEIPTLPQLPSAVPRRSHSATPVSPSIKPLYQEQSKSKVQVPDPTDLLNLGDSTASGGDDIFDAFLSAPQAPVPENSSVQQLPSSNNASVTDNAIGPSISNDEADFFNQKSDGNLLQSNKMSKESILSLYGSNTGPVPVTQPVAPSYGLPAGMYISQPVYSQMSMSAFTAVPNSGLNNPQTNMTPAYSPYASLGTSHIRQDPQHTNAWIGIPGSGIDSLHMAQGLGQVSQQMANLQLSGQAWNVMGNPAMNPSTVSVGANQSTNGMMWPMTACSQTPNISNTFWK